MAYDTSKLTKLAALKALGEEIKAKYATKTSVTNLENRINEIVATGGEPNAINKIKVNGVEQTIAADKSVDVKMPVKVSELNNDSKYQTETEVGASIQAAIAETGHAVFTKVDTVPAAANAADNVLYLVMNGETGHYDIYAKVGSEVLLIDDTTVDLTAYSTTEQMNAAIVAAATKVEKSSANGSIKVNGVEMVVYTLPDDVIRGSVATDDEVTEMLNEVFAE